MYNITHDEIIGLGFAFLPGAPFLGHPVLPNPRPPGSLIFCHNMPRSEETSRISLVLNRFRAVGCLFKTEVTFPLLEIMDLSSKKDWKSQFRSLH